MQGHGDYRFHLFVQFFLLDCLALIVALFPPRDTDSNGRCLVLLDSFMLQRRRLLHRAGDHRVRYSVTEYEQQII